MRKRSWIKRLLAYFYVPVIFCIIGYFVLWAALQPIWELGANYAAFLVAADMPVFNATLTTSYDQTAEKTVYLDKIYYDTYVKEADGSLTLYEQQHPCEQEYLKAYQERQKAATLAQLPAEADEAGATAADDSAGEAATGDIVKGDPYMLITDIDFPEAYDHYAQLTCDRIGLDAPVYWYDTPEILAAGVGQSIASKPPGYGRMILLSGHNTSFFRCLEDVKVGDVVRMDTNYCDYEYTVTNVEVMNENVLESSVASRLLADEEQLVMYTCYPFYVISGRKTDRLVVTCKRSQGIDIKWRGMDE